jgi:hypothetical protein
VEYVLAIQPLLQDWYDNAFSVTDTTANLETSFTKDSNSEEKSSFNSKMS